MLIEGDILRERYRVIERLGQGGMGAVYEAHDNVFDTSVALKEVIIDTSVAFDTKAQEMARSAFEREAKILAKINHETIPHVKDFFVEENSQFLVMELVDGVDLAKLLKERKEAFPIPTLLEWTDQLLDALEYLHSQSPPIIHRDIKPQNLKLTSRKKIKLLDFGIAKGTESQAANTVTNQTFVAATLNYSPIEQMIRVLDPTFLAVITHKYGDRVEEILKQNADVRTDIFALGATLYHLATNKHPAEAIKRGVEIWDGKPDPLENPRALNPSIPEEFAQFLLKAMRPSRDHRFATATEMRNSLQQILEVPTLQSLTPTVEMNFEELQGDATVPFVGSPDSIDAKPAKTAGPGQPVKPTEQETEVLDRDTAKEKVFAASQNIAASTAPRPAKKKRSKLLWLVPAAAMLLFVFAGGVIAVLVLISQYSVPADNSNVADTTNDRVLEKDGLSDSNTEPALESDQPATSDSQEAVDLNVDVDQPNPVPASTVTSAPAGKAAPRPTRKTTPRPRATVIVKKTPVKTPRKTPRPTPKKNLDCIFTDSCK
ncbi:MAG: protein kinase [Acidobacteriota bacterium]|nr:protein kinase [Acidobacteriota bacterium]